MTKKKEFWQKKKLHDMTGAEWEKLCDRCGLCCMHKIEDEDTGTIFATSIACQLLDEETCCCKNYPERQNFVPDCIKLTLALVETAPWLPKTCAYRLIYEGKDLPVWHPLKSQDNSTVHSAGISVRGKIALYEDALNEDTDYFEYMGEAFAKREI